jgi:hypothetical protein
LNRNNTKEEQEQKWHRARTRVKIVVLKEGGATLRRTTIMASKEKEEH